MSEPGVCECGHVAGEHVDESRECTAAYEFEGNWETCGCLMFEEAPHE